MVTKKKAIDIDDDTESGYLAGSPNLGAKHEDRKESQSYYWCCHYWIDCVGLH